jgi:hypothetical protein
MSEQNSVVASSDVSRQTDAMTPATIAILEEWQGENLMSDRGAIYEPDENPFNQVGIDGAVDLGELALKIQNSERERCAKVMLEVIADGGYYGLWLNRLQLALVEIQQGASADAPPQAEGERR